ncbi:hypothetical protein E5F92_002290 [Flavobacterium columnare]|uniref:DUF6046 domain-containing protein n=2 Tax=Flavobacterium columnare TaxID=996 RepID=UPI002989BD3D|nr:DUF6046 domain-containing protein [Flavobacterium columnare]MCH4831579.1 hypothetical protein [Flavobacterium columnare]
MKASAQTYPPLQPSNPDFKFEGVNMLGVPTLTTLALKGKVNGKTVKVELIECIITVTQDRNIVTTPLQGMDGTVKEYISDGDYQISVDAAISGYNEDSKDFEKSKAYPLEQMKPLMDLLKLKSSIIVQSDFLTLFDITDAVVKTYGMVQETHSNRQSFNIQLLSDKAIEIKQKSNA